MTLPCGHAAIALRAAPSCSGRAAIEPDAGGALGKESARSLASLPRVLRRPAARAPSASAATRRTRAESGRAGVQRQAGCRWVSGELLFPAGSLALTSRDVLGHALVQTLGWVLGTALQVDLGSMIRGILWLSVFWPVFFCSRKSGEQQALPVWGAKGGYVLKTSRL